MQAGERYVYDDGTVSLSVWECDSVALVDDCAEGSICTSRADTDTYTIQKRHPILEQAWSVDG